MSSDKHVSSATSLALAICCSLVAACSGDELTAPEETFARELQTALSEVLDASGGMGVSAAVIMPDGNTWVGVSGTSEPGVPVTTDMLFDMGSSGKNLFSALMLDLAEDGLLSLDDSLHQYLPPMPNVDSTITIRQCLNHTSGLYMAVEHPESPFSQPYNTIDFERWWTIDEIFSMFMGEPLFAPGESWHYTQAGYQLGTLIVQQLTDSTVAEQIQTRLLDPLGIDGMLLDLRDPIPERFEIAHHWVDTDGDGVPEDVSSRSRNWINSLSRILYYTRAEDFARWMHALMEGHVLTQASLDEMLTFVYPNPGEPMLAGYGLAVLRPVADLTLGQRLWGHSGSIPGFRAFAGYLPDYRITFSLLINSDSDDQELAVVQALLRVILGQAGEVTG